MAPAQDAFIAGIGDVLLLQDFQRQQEFLPEHVLAAAEIGLRRQHLDGVMRQLEISEIGLASPDRDHHGRRHAEALLDRGKRRGVFGGELAALLGQPRKLGFGQIFAPACARIPPGPSAVPSVCPG